MCAGLAGGECTGALAAGVNAMLAPETTIKICQLRVSTCLSHTLSDGNPFVLNVSMQRVKQVKAKSYECCKQSEYNMARAGAVSGWALQDIRRRCRRLRPRRGLYSRISHPWWRPTPPTGHSAGALTPSSLSVSSTCMGIRSVAQPVSVHCILLMTLANLLPLTCRAPTQAGVYN